MVEEVGTEEEERRRWWRWAKWRRKRGSDEGGRSGGNRE